MNRLRSTIKLEIGQKQAGVCETHWKRDSIFIFRIISERTIKKQKHVYLSFTDNEKETFDEERYKKTIGTAT